MLIKMAVLGALGYAGYKFLKSADRAQGQNATAPQDVRLAGGPLSKYARVQHSADVPPASTS